MWKESELKGRSEKSNKKRAKIPVSDFRKEKRGFKIKSFFFLILSTKELRVEFCYRSLANGASVCCANKGAKTTFLSVFIFFFTYFSIECGIGLYSKLLVFVNTCTWLFSGLEKGNSCIILIVVVFLVVSSRYTKCVNSSFCLHHSIFLFHGYVIVVLINSCCARDSKN